MGYQSQVAITLKGTKTEVQNVLNAYKLTETSEQINNTWHILHDDEFSTYKHYQEWVNGDEDKLCALVFVFDWVKFYEDSQKALNRLGDIVDEMNKTSDQGITLSMKRIGESDDDYETMYWGADDFDSEVDYVRRLEVDIPADPKALEKVFSSTTEQTDIPSESSQHKE
jgi:hypothetical protein